MREHPDSAEIVIGALGGELDAAELALSVAFARARAVGYRPGPWMDELSAAEDRYGRARQHFREQMTAAERAAAGASRPAVIDLRGTSAGSATPALEHITPASTGHLR